VSKQDEEEVKIMTFPLKTSVPANTEFVRTQMETRLLCLEEMNGWTLPPFQREEVQNRKVVEFAERLMENGGMIGGVIHLGVLRHEESVVYLVDGQQRRGGCNLSGLPEFIADVSRKIYDSMAEMAEDFKNINSRLVGLRPDDLLRAYEMSHDELRRLREDCPFVGYSSVRRDQRSWRPVVSMSATLRCWFGSAKPTPNPTNAAVSLLDQLTVAQREPLTVFLRTAHSAWGSEPENYRLWNMLNLTICMYLYRALVMEPSNRRLAVPPEMFRKCLMSVSANADYCDWLHGRNVGERDRVPCYKRLKTIFSTRLTSEYGGKLYKMPKPEWMS
jgi:hypothetical protein